LPPLHPDDTIGALRFDFMQRRSSMQAIARAALGRET
jgi:hypothetical protein